MVGKLRSHMLHGIAKSKQRKKNREGSESEKEKQIWYISTRL